MSLLPCCTESSDGIHYFAPNLPAGVSTGLSWTQIGTTGFYTADIINVSPNLTATSALSVSLQAANTVDTYNCWILTAYPVVANGGTIRVDVAGLPASPSTFAVSWAVTKY